jgi:putative membrane protein
MVTWFAGLFYLPRLFVYHASAEDAVSLARFATMERRLFALTTIGASGTIGFGIWLMIGWWWPPPAWLQAKLALVLLLIIYHLTCGRMLSEFRAGRNRRSERFYRWFNEIPSLLLIGIVILVVVQPF